MSNFPQTQENNYSRCPIIIVGAQHAGTRAVVLMLEALGSQPGLIDNEWKEEKLFLRLHRELVARVSNFGWNKTIFNLTFVRNFVDDASGAGMVDKEITDDLAKHVPEAQSRPWHWKCPASALFLPTWLTVYPDALFVHVVRSGSGVAESLLRRRQFYNPFRAYTFNQAMNERIESIRPRMRHYIRIRHEQLETDLDRLIEFVPLTPTAEQRATALAVIRRPRRKLWSRAHSVRRNIWERVVALLVWPLRWYEWLRPDDFTLDSAAVSQRYNRDITQKWSHRYEYHRWFKTPLRRAGYEMTKRAISRHYVAALQQQSHARILEVGPGAGTWTKHILEHAPAVAITAVDVSDEMIGMARAATAEYGGRVEFTQADIAQWAPPTQERYDALFSSRALEYMPDKKRALEHMIAALRADGYGCVITKLPHYWRARLRGRNTQAFHQGQISPRRLRALLQAAGCGNIRMYPVTISVPLLHWGALNNACQRLLYRLPLNTVTAVLSESYCVTFQKK